MLKKGFPEFNDVTTQVRALGARCRTGAYFGLFNNLSTFSYSAVKSQAANDHRFLTQAIFFAHSLYASVQGLSRRIQCYNPERSQATPEEVSKFSET